MKGMFNFGLLGIRRVFGGVMPPKPSIDKWVKEHMVFWYDMSKPVDVYTQNFNDWENYNPNSVSITNNKIVVNGLIDNFRIASIGKETESFSVFIEGLGDKNLVYRVKLDENSNKITNIKLKDGENVLPHSFATTVAFMGASGVTDYIGLTITQLPSGQSVPTNEILKANPYLQDFSGNNRPLKLNNFLFAAMSGVGGYTDNFNDWIINSKKATVKLESSSSVTIQAITQEHIGVVYKYENGKRTIIKVNITGITEEIKGKFAFGYADVTGNHNIILENGYFEFDTDKYEGIVGWYGFKSIVPINICNITIEQIPLYPNALVTDGVDDYGQIQNLQHGVKVLFYTCNNFRLSQMLYDQRKIGYDNIQSSYFSIFAGANTIAYNARNVDGKTYIDGVLNETTIVDNLLGKKTIITIVNNSVDSEKTGRPSFFSTYNNLGYFANLAFYNSIGFDSVPTKETDGFTEQDLITWVIDNMINGTPQSGVFPYVFPLKVN